MEIQDNNISLNPMMSFSERLDSIFLNILSSGNQERLIRPDLLILEDLKSVLNRYLPDMSCKKVIFTLNTDKQFFGIKVQPILTSSDALDILLTEEKVKLKETCLAKNKLN